MIIEIAKTEKVAGNGINMEAQIPGRWGITKERKGKFICNGWEIDWERKDKGIQKVNVLLEN